MFVLTVKVKDPEHAHSHKFMIYDHCKVSQDDEIIKQCVLITIKECGFEPETIKCTINLEVVL